MAEKVHDHTIPDLHVYDRATIVEQFGHTVSASIPKHPKRLETTIHRIGADPVTVMLTSLPCGCGAIIHAAHAASLRAADLEAHFQEILTPTRTGDQVRNELKRLRAAARAGKRVDRHELAAAIELVELADAADAEAAADAHELSVALLADAIRAVGDEWVERLEGSAINLQTLQTDAYKAVVALIDAAKEHEHLAAMAATSVGDAAGEPVNVLREHGETRRMRLDGELVEWWPAQSWAAGLLEAVNRHHNLIGRSRMDRSELPRVWPSDPRPTTTTDST